MPIPIENIYYLLSYAWNKLEEKDRVSVSTDDRTELLDLFAKVLLSGCRILLKSGLEKYYVSRTIDIPGVKGKLEMAATLKQGLHLKQRTICSIDEFSSDVLTNQILLATFFRLLRIRELDNELKAEVRNVIRMFPAVSLIELKKSNFGKVRLHRNNRFYGFLMNVCELIYDNTLPGEVPGAWSFVDFTRDEQKMNKLFEAFILNFYKRVYPAWDVSSRLMDWRFTCSGSVSDLDYLPVMRTDISIDKEDEKIIVDAKYYQETMASNWGKEKIKSGNLYQIFSYLLNQRDGSEIANHTRGILIYPTISDEFDLEYKYENHTICIKTVNLNMNWRLIEKRLRKIINE